MDNNNGECKWICVKGNPVGKGRPIVNTRTNTAFTPKKTREYEKLVAECWKEQTGGFSFGGDVPLNAIIQAYFPIPKSYTKKRKREIITQGIKPLKKPDGDNIDKIIFDALNGVAYEDDKQICVHTTEKHYCSSEDMEGYVLVTINQL